MIPHTLYLATITVLIVIIAVTAITTKVHLNTIQAAVSRQISLPPFIPGARTYAQYRADIDGLIEHAHNDFGPINTKLSTACRTALQGGKRLRAIILCEIARMASVGRQTCDPREATLFIEYVHTASLIIDDSPAFDNDLTRRDRPALHAEVGTAVAQMAALSLVAAGFHNICRQIDWIRSRCHYINADQIGTLVCATISQALGASGAARGQYMDISPIHEFGADAVAELLYLKTATFFEMATVVGWLIAGGSSVQIPMLRDIGRHVGIAFQVADDIGDMASDASRALEGKPGWNFANIYGLDAALIEVEFNLKSAEIALKRCACWTPLWIEIYDKVRNMYN